MIDPEKLTAVWPLDSHSSHSCLGTGYSKSWPPPSTSNLGNSAASILWNLFQIEDESLGRTGQWMPGGWQNKSLSLAAQLSKQDAFSPRNYHPLSYLNTESLIWTPPPLSWPNRLFSGCISEAISGQAAWLHPSISARLPRRLEIVLLPRSIWNGLGRFYSHFIYEGTKELTLVSTE